MKEKKENCLCISNFNNISYFFLVRMFFFANNRKPLKSIDLKIIVEIFDSQRG